MMSNLHTVSIEWVLQKGIIIIGQKANIERAWLEALNMFCNLIRVRVLKVLILR